MATNDHERIAWCTAFGVDWNPRQIQHLQQIGEHQFRGQVKSDEIKIAGGPM